MYETNPEERLGVVDFDLARNLIESRVNTGARRLISPGLDQDRLLALLSLAGAAPDHGRLTPWRFIIIPTNLRSDLGNAFVESLLLRDSLATQEQLERARKKAFHAPTLVVCIVKLRDHVGEKITVLEQMVSFGAAIQNILLGSKAMGFDAGLTSGQAMNSPPMRRLLGLSAGEQAVCFINLGTAEVFQKVRNSRPKLQEFVTELSV